MKLKHLIIYYLPINFINSVYIVGKSNDYYKIYLEQDNNHIIKIELKRTIKENFNNIKVYRKRYIGKATKSTSAPKAFELLNNNTWEKGTAPNPETLKITLELLKIENFRPVKRDIKKNLPFFLWLKEQKDRDDLIGDIAYDISIDKSLGLYKTYKELKSYILHKQQGRWEINSFKEADKESGMVSPTLCLKLAKMEYDLYKKKEKLKKFKNYNTNGYIYFLKPINEDGPIKIGRARDITKRIRNIQSSLPFDLKLIGYISTSDYVELEKEIHQIFKDKRLKREWFDLTFENIKDIIKNYNGEIVK